MKISVIGMLSAVLVGIILGLATAGLVISLNPEKPAPKQEMVAEQPKAKERTLPIVYLSTKDLKQDKVNPLIRQFGNSQLFEEADYLLVIRHLNMKFYAHAGYIGEEYTIILIPLHDSPDIGNFKRGDYVNAKDLWPKLHEFEINYHGSGPG
jgi:hypothetical protein